MTTAAARLARVDALADAFERDWSPEDDALLARTVDAAPPDVRADVARELVKLDAELRAGRGLPIDPTTYCRRVPAILDAAGWPPDDVLTALERAAKRRGGGDAPPAWPGPAAGDVVGGYRLVSRRALSRCPVVFDAVDPVTGGAVLVSVYPPMRPSAAEATRAAVLAFVAAAAGHVPAVRAVGPADGRLFVVQDPPPGDALAAFAGSDGLPWR
ncbi:MAG TPA: hypothetical protein VF796_20170, partial [Humisphaera sp.]